MIAKSAGIGAGIAVLIGLLIPDGVMTSSETIMTVLAMWYMAALGVWYTLEMRQEIREKREELSCRAHKPDRGNRDNLRTDIRLKKKSWVISIPAEKVVD